MSSLPLQPNEDVSADVQRKMKALKLFLLDVLDDASLADRLPDRPEYLDMYERGARTGVKPDFQTPRVDVYVIPRNELHPNHLVGLDREI